MIKTILAVLVLIPLGAWYIGFTSEVDEAQAVRAQQYGECIKYEYGVNPTYYYDMHGVWPECKSSASWYH